MNVFKRGLLTQELILLEKLHDISRIPRHIFNMYGNDVLNVAVNDGNCALKTCFGSVRLFVRYLVLSIWIM